MKELEAKFKIECRELDNIKHRIESLGFELVKTADEIDYYYNHPCIDFLAKDEALRVRVRGEFIELTYKGPRSGGEFKLRDEYSVAVDSMTITKILELLGFKQVLVIEKNREYYAKGSILVSLDRVKELGCFLEIEAKDGDINAIKDIIESLGLPMESHVPRTYVELFLGKS